MLPILRSLSYWTKYSYRIRYAVIMAVELKMSKPFQTSIGPFSVAFHQFFLDKLFHYHPMFLCRFKHKQGACVVNCNKLRSHGILRTISQCDGLGDSCEFNLPATNVKKQITTQKAQAISRLSLAIVIFASNSVREISPIQKYHNTLCLSLQNFA